MIRPNRSIALACLVAAGLFLVQPAWAATATVHSCLVDGWQGITDVLPIGQRRCYVYRDGRRVYRPCQSPRSRQPKQKAGSYGTTRGPGYDKPWGGHEPCANCPTAR